MNILFVGGDQRQLEIINDLYHKNYDIDLLGYDAIEMPKEINKKMVEETKISKYNVIFFPVSGVKKDYQVATDFSKEKLTLNKNFLVGAKEEALIFTGIRTPELNAILDTANKSVVALMEDNDIKKENGIPTVEGIIGDLIYHTDYTINDAKILVLGYGNVGKPLVETLKCLGANLTVGVIKEEDYQSLMDKNIKPVYTDDIANMQRLMTDGELDIIVNTVPELILNKEYLNLLNKNAYILDVSSYPHGVDFEAANNLKIKNNLLLGIPSLVAPKTAGKILVKKINSIIGGER